MHSSSELHFLDDNEFFILLRDTLLFYTHTYYGSRKTIFSLCDWMTGFKYTVYPKNEKKKFFFLSFSKTFIVCNMWIM